MTFAPEMTNAALIDRLTAFFAARGLEAYMVGGAVRDRMLGRVSSSDLDLAVKGDAVALGRALGDELGGSLAPSSVPAGMMRVALSPPRGEDGEAEDSICIIDLSGFYGDIKFDLERRDFTVNAMAVPLADWRSGDWAARMIDPFGGRADLMRKAIRALYPGVFQDEPGRLLRAVRISGELGLRIEPDTVRMLAANAHRLPGIPSERIGSEFLRMLAANGARGRIETLDRLGLLQHAVPELMAAKGVEQPRAHYWDVWGHTLQAVEFAEGVTGGHQNSPVFSCVPWTPESEAHFARQVCDGHTRRTILKLAALFHDIAKPQTKSLEADGRTRFFGHPEQGAVIAEIRLTALRLGSRGVNMVSRMVEHHLRPANMSPANTSANMSREGKWPTNRAIFRYFRDTGDVAIDTLYLCLADYLAAKGPDLAHPQWLEHAKMISHVLHTGTQEPFAATAPRLVTGHDLMLRFQLRPGPHIGSLLEAIEEARAAGEIETQEQALELAADTLNHTALHIPGCSLGGSQNLSG